VLNKPPGLATQGGTGTHLHVDGLLDAFHGDDEPRPRLVHRLDKDTSGVLLVARTPGSAAFFSKRFSGRSAKKVYWALVVGVPEADDGISVLDLEQVLDDGPSIVPPIPITPDPFADASGLEVDIVAAGDLAVVREAGGAWLRAVGLVGATAGQMWEVDLPGVPSDLEMSPDGLRAYAVLREQGQLAVLDLPGDVVDPTGIELIDLPAGTAKCKTPLGDLAKLFEILECVEQI
jgi:hypothetical protein